MMERFRMDKGGESGKPYDSRPAIADSGFSRALLPGPVLDYRFENS
jgi:hypothetical protein